MSDWEKRANRISIVLISLDTSEELDENIPYNIGIVLGTPEDPKSKEMRDLEKAFETAITVNTVKVTSIITLSEDDITYRMLKQYKRWDRDYRSLPVGSERELPEITADVG